MKILLTIILIQTILLCEAFASSGTFIIVKNNVTVKKKGGSTETAKVGAGVAVGDTIISAADSRAKIAMEDRNIITVLPNSQLVIEEYKASAKDKNVKLSLLEGKVRNDVKEKYDNEKNKFQIRTPTAVAGVRGTKFITSFDANTNVTEVITLKGEVVVTKYEINKANPLGTVTVEQGEKATFADDAAPPSEPVSVPKTELREVDTDSTAKKETKPDDESRPTTTSPPPPPPRPVASPTEGIKQPGQLPPFLINNPNNVPGKVKPVLTSPQ